MRCAALALKLTVAGACVRASARVRVCVYSKRVDVCVLSEGESLLTHPPPFAVAKHAKLGSTRVGPELPRARIAQLADTAAGLVQHFVHAVRLGNSQSTTFVSHVRLESSVSATILVAQVVKLAGTVFPRHSNAYLV